MNKLKIQLMNYMKSGIRLQRKMYEMEAEDNFQ